MPVMIQFVPDTAATGSITTVAVANLVDGETVTLSDGFTALTFEFDGVSGPVDGVLAGNVVVDVSADTTADDVRDRLIAVINAQPGFNLSAASGGAATVDLTNALGGTLGNVSQSETVADGGFAVTAMAGGLDDGAFGGPLAKLSRDRRRVRWVLQTGNRSSAHIAHHTWFGGPAGTYAQPPNSVSVVVKYGGPSWFDTPLEFNALPNYEIRNQIANEMERNILQVIDSTGALATPDQVRGGLVN